jgi:transcriptional regulator with XRE-family HTH domain
MTNESDVLAADESPGTGMTKDQIKKAFAARLKTAMLRKGWNQSQLAEQASLFVDKKMGRDNISIYMNARSLPGPTNLYAISRALGVPMTELLPEAMADFPVVDEPTGQDLEIKALPELPGYVRIRLNKKVSMSKAVKIMQILEEEAS